jgi:hypothetical protein
VTDDPEVRTASIISAIITLMMEVVRVSETSVFSNHPDDGGSTHF